jgi:hypothetical protein
LNRGAGAFVFARRQTLKKGNDSMKRASTVAVFAILIFAGAVCAQNPPQAPKPSPELKRLNYFVGHWATEAEMKPSPFGPGGKFTSKEHTEWMPGDFFLVTHSQWKGASMGEGTGLAVMGYNADEKVYTYNAFNSMGEAEASKGKVDGDTWTWTSNEKMGGKPTKSRFTVKELSPTSYSFKFEIAPEGGDWATIMEGKATKTP